MVRVNEMAPDRGFQASKTGVHRLNTFGAATFPLITIVLGLVIPMIAVSDVLSTRSYPEWPLGWVVAAYSGGRLAYLTASGAQKLYLFSFYLYVYLFLGLAPLAQLAAGSFPSVAPWVDPHNLAGAFIVIIVGLVAFEVGRLFAPTRPRTPGSGPCIAPSRTYILSIVAISTTLVFIVIVGPETFLQPRNSVFAAIQDSISNASGAALIRGFVVGALLVSFAAVASISRMRRLRVSAPLRLLGILLLTLSLFVTNVVNSPRYLALVVVVGIASTLGIFATRARTRVAYVGALSGFIVVFPMLGGLRTSLNLAQGSGRLGDVFLSGDFDSFAEVANAVGYVSSIGMEGGRQLLGALLVWVPRSIWSDKPISTSTLVADSMGYQFTNVSAPLWSELLVDFGYAGVLAGFLLIGMLFRRLDDSLVSNYSRNTFPGVAGFIVPFYLVILLRGALLSTVPTLLVMLLCIWFVSTGRSARGQSDLVGGANVAGYWGR